MRIAYLVHFRSGATSGIFRKVATHASEWTARGHQVGLFVATDPDAAGDWEGLPEAVSVLAAGRGIQAMFRGRERLAGDLLRWRPDVVYARHTLAYPGLVRIVRRHPTVFEINSDDLAEFRLVSPRRYRFARLTRGLLLARAAGLVFVTHELERDPAFARFRRPSLVVPNGIRLADYPTLPPTRAEHARAVFVGHPHTPWHGLEHLDEIARAFPDWRVDVVGPDSGELSGPTAANLRFHGELLPSDSRPFLAAADVAIGTLGLYRKRMDEASPLKTREYLASGLPVIAGYRDTDFPDGAPFLLAVPNRPDGVATSLREIRAFVDGWRGRRVSHDDVLAIDIGVKEERRLAFMRSLLTGSA